MRGCWQGEVADVPQELRNWQTSIGEPPPECPGNDPRQILATTLTYLKNNQHRMKSPEDRCAGLPVTTAWMESLVKELNSRVKGTEMFWNDPEGAEAILQVRAAALCDDDRLVNHLRTRPGHPVTRRPNLHCAPRFLMKVSRVWFGGSWSAMGGAMLLGGVAAGRSSPSLPVLRSFPRCGHLRRRPSCAAPAGPIPWGG